MQLGERRFCPDLSFLLADDADRIQGGCVVRSVDLVVEMVSANTREYDPGEKRDTYREGRIPEIWFIDADRRECRIHLPEGQTYRTLALREGRFAGRFLPCFSVDVRWFWFDLLPNPLDCLNVVDGEIRLVRRPLKCALGT